MRLLLAFLIAGGLQYRTGSPVLAVAAGALAYAGTCWREIRDEIRRRGRRGRWWSEENLVAALQGAGVLPVPKDGQPRPVLRRRGRPQITDAGVGVKIALPPGIPFSEVVKRQAQLAASMRPPVPVKHLQAIHDDDDPANVGELFVGAPAKTHARSPLATADRTSWLDPVRIGVDDRGRPVYLGTFQENSIVAGAPGSGKTTLGRLPAGHYLLDPATLIYGLDGKGSREDYAEVAKLAVRWVWGGSNEQAGEQTLAMLREILAVVNERNEASTHGATVPPGVLLILEEFQNIRTAAPKTIREEIDSVLGQVVRMGRAVAVHVLISTQRPSVDDLPSGFRNLVTQRAALKLPVAADAKLVLGHTPDLPIPKRVGEAIVGLPDGDRAVVVDYLDGKDWIALCRRAAKLRYREEHWVEDNIAAATAPPATRELEAATIEQPAAADPLRDLVVEILRSSADCELSPRALWTAVQATGVEITETALGRATGTMAGVEKGKDGSGRVVRLSESGRREIGAGNPS